MVGTLFSSSTTTKCGPWPLWPAETRLYPYLPSIALLVMMKIMASIIKLVIFRLLMLF
jgi:hypothetical protein